MAQPQPTHIKLALTETSGYSVNADGTGGTPAGGTAIGRWTDSSGNGYHFTKNGAPTLPGLYRATALGGKPMADFNGRNGTLAASATPLTTLQGSGAWTVVMAGQVDPSWVTGGGGAMFGEWDGSSGRWLFGIFSNLYADFSNDTTFRGPTAGEFVVLAYTWDSTLVNAGVANGAGRAYINGAGRCGQSIRPTASSDVPLTVGGFANNFLQWPGKVGAVYAWDVALSPGDVYRAAADLYARFGQTMPACHAVCYGHSYFGQASTGQLAESVAARLGVHVDTVHVLARGGLTDDDLLTDLTNYGSIWPALPAGGAKKVGVIYGGTNDNPSFVTGAQGVAKLMTVSDSLKAAGCEYLINCTLTPYLATTSTNMTVFRPAFDAAMRTSYAAHSDYLADIASDPVMGVNGVQDNPTYYQATPGGIHPTRTGYDLMSPYVAAGVNAANAGGPAAHGVWPVSVYPDAVYPVAVYPEAVRPRAR